MKQKLGSVQGASIHSGQKRSLRMPAWVGLLVFLIVATFLLWEEHKVHIMGALLWVLLTACLLAHFFMHGSHGDGADTGRHSGHGETGDKPDGRTGGAE